MFFVVTSSKLDFNLSFVPYSIGFAIAYAVASIFMVLAIAHGSLTLTSLFISYSLMIPTFYGLIIGDTVGAGFIPGLLLLVISLFLTNNSDEKAKFSFKWIMWSLAALITAGPI